MRTCRHYCYRSTSSTSPLMVGWQICYLNCSKALCVVFISDFPPVCLVQSFLGSFSYRNSARIPSNRNLNTRWCTLSSAAPQVHEGAGDFLIWLRHLFCGPHSSRCIGNPIGTFLSFPPHYCAEAQHRCRTIHLIFSASIR